MVKTLPNNPRIKFVNPYEKNKVAIIHYDKNGKIKKHTPKTIIRKMAELNNFQGTIEFDCEGEIIKKTPVDMQIIDEDETSPTQIPLESSSEMDDENEVISKYDIPPPSYFDTDDSIADFDSPSILPDPLDWESNFNCVQGEYPYLQD